jgi:hypothetical protein
LTSWRYGRAYGGWRAAAMIMSVIMNRVRLGWGTLLEVIDNIPNKAATTEIPTGWPSIWEPDFVKLLHEVEGIYEGTKDHSKGALYWCDSRYVETDFFKEKILGDQEAHPRVAEMNSLMFFL